MAEEEEAWRREGSTRLPLSAYSSCHVSLYRAAMPARLNPRQSPPSLVMRECSGGARHVAQEWSKERARTSEGIARRDHVPARPRAEAAHGKAGIQRRRLVSLYQVAAKVDDVLFGVDD